MAEKREPKDPHTLPTIRTTSFLRSGAYPSEPHDSGDTDPLAVESGSFDDNEDTRAESPHHVPDITEAHHAPPAQLDSAGYPDMSSSEDVTAHGVVDEDETRVGGSTVPGGWDLNDWDNFWMRVQVIEAAGTESDEALARVLRKHGLRDRAHFDEVRAEFQERFGDDPAFAQAALRTRASKHQMQARMQGELKGELAPVEGVSLEKWAWLMAKIASGGNLRQLLGLARIDDAKWERVSAEWNARMSRDTTATIATAYGQAFVATGPDPFGAAGK
jgi:hypothetical protein